MFSFIGMPAFVCIALVIGIRLHLIAAVVLWVSWAVPIGVVLPIWYAEDHINSMSATWMVPIILILILGTTIAVANHFVIKKHGFQNPVIFRWAVRFLRLEAEIKIIKFEGGHHSDLM